MKTDSALRKKVIANVENYRVFGGGTIIGHDEETLRQIEAEQKRKLKRKEFYQEILKDYKIKHYLTNQMTI